MPPTGAQGLWKEEWTSTSSNPENSVFGLTSCAEPGVRGKGSAELGATQPGSKDAPQIVLTGWYRAAGTDPKRAWTQALVKKVDSRGDRRTSSSIPTAQRTGAARKSPGGRVYANGTTSVVSPK